MGQTIISFKDQDNNTEKVCRKLIKKNYVFHRSTLPLSDSSDLLMSECHCSHGSSINHHKHNHNGSGLTHVEINSGGSHQQQQLSSTSTTTTSITTDNNEMYSTATSHLHDCVVGGDHDSSFEETNQNGSRNAGDGDGIVLGGGLDNSVRRHSSMDQLAGLLNQMGSSSSSGGGIVGGGGGNRQRSLSDSGKDDEENQPDLLNNTPPVPPKRAHRRRHTPPRPVSNGLPPTPKVHMGACFSKIFNGCPLRITCTASWIHPETRDQHLLIGAEEGIFNLNMNELHDAVIDQMFPRRTTWMYVIKDVLMSMSGKSSQLYRHDLLALHSKQTHRFSMHMNKIPERLVPRKFALTTKVPDTKGCIQCCVTRNPYNGYKYLCGSMASGIFLMQWYDPLNKFMLLKQFDWPSLAINIGGLNPAVNGGFTAVFEMIIAPELEYPMVCIAVKKGTGGAFKLDLINMNGGMVGGFLF